MPGRQNSPESASSKLATKAQGPIPVAEKFLRVPSADACARTHAGTAPTFQVFSPKFCSRVRPLVAAIRSPSSPLLLPPRVFHSTDAAPRLFSSPPPPTRSLRQIGAQHVIVI
uniref:Uncharacterized protein n=1 Tax=Leersia perrieri TaxID=77586 RepID=A0A0D9WXK0_9ORYZ